MPGIAYFAIYGLGLSRTVSGLLSFPFAVGVTWIGNRLFTFRGLGSDSAKVQFLKFLVVCLGGLIFNRGTYALLVQNVPLVFDYPVLGLLAGTGVGMFSNFFLARQLVFK